MVSPRRLAAVAAVALGCMALAGLAVTTRSSDSTELLWSKPPRHAARDLMSNILGGMEQQSHQDIKVRPGAVCSGRAEGAIVRAARKVSRSVEASRCLSNWAVQQLKPGRFEAAS